MQLKSQLKHSVCLLNLKPTHIQIKIPKRTISALSLAICSSFSFTSSSLLRAATDTDASFSFWRPVFILKRRNFEYSWSSQIWLQQTCCFCVLSVYYLGFCLLKWQHNLHMLSFAQHCWTHFEQFTCWPKSELQTSFLYRWFCSLEWRINKTWVWHGWSVGI